LHERKGLKSRLYAKPSFPFHANGRLIWHESFQNPCSCEPAQDSMNWLSNRRDRSPYPRRTLPSLQIVLVSAGNSKHLRYNVPSSFSSTFSSAAAAPPEAAPPAAGAPAPDPPDGTDANLLEPSEINYPYISHEFCGDILFSAHTSWRSLPLSSEMRVLRRSSSASMPTDSRTVLTSLAEGVEFPPRERRR